jgi:hypothetical protein
MDPPSYSHLYMNECCNLSFASRWSLQSTSCSTVQVRMNSTIFFFFKYCFDVKIYIFLLRNAWSCWATQTDKRGRAPILYVQSKSNEPKQMWQPYLVSKIDQPLEMPLGESLLPQPLGLC